MEGWQQVTDRCVFNYINSPSVQILCAKERYGKKELLNIIPVIKRKRASFPNAMWGIDGSPFELAYRDYKIVKTKDENGVITEKKKEVIGRLYVFMVIDYYSNKWVGIAISETETGETVMMAVKNACTTHNCLPHQIQSDNSSAIIRCKSQLEQIATHFTPAKVGWSRSKRVEAVQGHINSTILKWYGNHTGANITAKTKDRKINPDEAKKVLPTRAEVIRQIYEVQALWNMRKNGKGISPDELHAHEQPKHRPLGLEERIRLFGVPRRKPVKYTNQGITLKIGGEDVTFTVPDVDFYINHYNEKFLVKVDPEDTTMIGLFNPEDGRFIEWAFEATLVPEAEVDHTKRTKLEQYRQNRFQDAIEEAGEQDTLDRARILDAETITKLEIGVGSRYKDNMNAAAEQLKVLELVGVLEPTQHKKPLRGLYDAEDGDTGKPLD